MHSENFCMNTVTFYELFYGGITESCTYLSIMAAVFHLSHCNEEATLSGLSSQQQPRDFC